MKASLNWLRRLVDLPETPQEVADALTAAGLEVEAIEAVFALDGVVVGEVRSAEKVEGTRLSQCVVFDGTKELPIVCGAANVRAGLKVALATVGTRLPGDLEIKPASVRGMESLGMLCAEDELGLGDGHEGILELDPTSRPGTPFAQAMGLADTVFEINVTPNRPDATGHLGLARELAARFGRPLRNPLESLSATPPGNLPSVKVEVEPGCGCTRYVGRTVRGVRNGRSPDWMRNLLRAVGLRPISALVDITNFVLMEIGQPLHAFDLARVQGGISVRGARPGETLRTLDGIERTLTPGDLVVADAQGPQCLGGVMGGEGSGVSEATTDIFLETAYFQPSVVRKLARRCGLASDSSYRFERGVDPFATALVSQYAAGLVVALCGGVADAAQDLVLPGHLTESVKVAMAPGRIAARLGTDVPPDRIRSILVPLGFSPVEASGEEAVFSVPGWRPDVRCEADLSEEIARSIGYDRIEPCDLVYPVSAVRLPARERWTRRLRRAFSSRGVHETLSLRFVARRDHDRMGFPAQDPRSALVTLANPLSDDWAALPRLGVVNLLRSARRNETRQERSVRLFECVRVFGKDLPEAFESHRRIGIGERNVFAAVLAGPMPHAAWADEAPLDFWRAKGILQAGLADLGLRPSFVATSLEPWLHPGRAAELRLDGRAMGVFGQLHPKVQDAWDLRQETFAWEIDLDGLVELLESRPAPQVAAPSEFSATRREINAILPVGRPAEELLGLVRSLPQAKHPLLREVSLASVYQGAGVLEGHKALLLRFRYQSDDRTLTDLEVNEVHNALRGALDACEGISLK
jgi:phenylalanyl-tRNA synthetase beta chain